MTRRWLITGFAPIAGVGVWAACTGEDPPLFTVADDAGANPDTATTETSTKGPVFTVTVTPSDVGLVRQGSSFALGFNRSGGRGTATVKAQLAPPSAAITLPPDFTQLEGQPAQTFDIAVGASAPQADYELTFFANDDSSPVAQASAKVRFRVIGPPGALDQSFGGADAGTGVVLVPNAAFSSLLALPNGKVVAGGGSASDFVVVRLEADGKLDPTFGAGGIVRDTVNAGSGAVALALDGNDILAAGGVGKIVVRRYSATGAPTPVVDVLKAGVDVHDMVLSPDNKIVLAGGAGVRKTHVAAKFLADGGPDGVFSNDGVVEAQISTATANDRSLRVAAMADGHVIAGGRTFVTGSTDGQIAIVRYNPDGGVDPTYANNGSYIYQFGQGFEEEVRAVTVTADGSVHFLSVQTRNNEGRVVTVSRLLPSGARDPQWWPAPNPAGYSLFAANDGGVVPIRGVEIDGGAWLFAGTTQSGQIPLVGRVSALADPDTTFGGSGFSTFAVGANAQARAAALDAKGFIIVAGASGSNGFVARMFP